MPRWEDRPPAYAFTGGDAEMDASLRRMREAEDALAASRRPVMNRELIAYLERAMAVLGAA
jgi:hypothetical protein